MVMLVLQMRSVGVNRLFGVVGTCALEKAEKVMGGHSCRYIAGHSFLKSCGGVPSGCGAGVWLAFGFTWCHSVFSSASCPTSATDQNQ
jgi:hypothetical protein